MVLVPVTCSCSGQYYQSNTSYVIESESTYLLIANDTFQGLSTCQALQGQNSIAARDLSPGTRINVPLRCACPTKNQVDLGFNYLLTYVVTWADTVSGISTKFGVNFRRTLEDNEITEQDPTVYPFTTLLVPLENPPSESQITTPPPSRPSTPPPPTPAPSSNKSSSKTWVYVLAGVLGGGALLIAIGGVAFLLCRKRKMKKDQISRYKSFEAIEKQVEKKNDEEPEYFLESVSDIAQSLKVYTYQQLQSATEDFGPKCWIKGSVYRGKINGDFAAIKKIDGDVSKEINLLNKINHSNLIRLSGVCFKDGHWYLVYEYAVNGPLSDWIYGTNSDNKFLSWTQRMQIALDVATGLNYLHSYTSPPCVHKDLKSSNVLLDSDFRAKIANFGLARSTEGQEGQFALTRHIVGTKGYMAPEYLENGIISSKLDVYAFGIFLLEILMGKEVSVLNEEVKNKNLSEVLNDVFDEKEGRDNLGNFIDRSLQGNYPPELAIFVTRIIHRCIKKDPSGRPGMDEIVQSLSNIMASSMNWELSNSISGYRSFS